MSQKKEEGSFEGLCDSCKKKKMLQNVSGLHLCYECEEEFFEPLHKINEQQEHGRDIVNDQKMKKKID